MQIVILTGSEIRHEYFRMKIASDSRVSVLASYCEGAEKSLENRVQNNEDSSTLEIQHVQARLQAEKDFFNDYILSSDDKSKPKFIAKGEINEPSIVNEIIKLKPDLLVCYGSSLIKSNLLQEFKRKFLFDLAILGGIGLTLTIGISKLVGTIGTLAGLALKFAFSTLLVAPFKAAINFVRRNVDDFVKNFRKYVARLLTKGPGQILKLLNPKNLLIGGGAFGMGQGLGINQKIANFFRSVTGRKIVTGATKEAMEGGAKTGLRGVMQKVPYVGSVIDIIYGIFDYRDRKKNLGQTEKEARMGAGGKTIGGLIPFLTAMVIAPEPFSTATGTIGLIILSALGMYAGENIGDNLSGLKEKQKKDPTYGTGENVEGRADGGPVDAKKPYLVGERGPELFSSDVAGMITPINFKKESKVSDVISSFEQSAEVTVIPLGTSEKGLPASASMPTSSSTPADAIPNIPSSDFANAFVGLSESMYNVVV